MTGTIILGHLRPSKDCEPLPVESLFNNIDFNSYVDYYQQSQKKMTSASQQGLPIQLTPLWEYVVRTRKFPSNIDLQMTFDEISERLNDPEWEVRQHALRVLIDVLPTLEADVIDESMKSVIPELVKNLGNSAPAVRKGSLDALRVFLLHCKNRDKMIKNILRDGLNRQSALDNFQTNITTGVLLSTPLLLFPAKGISRPSVQVLKEATQILLSHLVQVTHQEAALKSLIKIREFVGSKEFDSYLQDIDNKVKSDFEALCDIYSINLNGKSKQADEDIRKSYLDLTNNRDPYNTHSDFQKVQNGNFKGDQYSVKEMYESDSDTSGIVEEDEETFSGTIPSARVVLETEIKFNEETAITMTILEEKDQNSDESDEDSDTEEEHGDCSLEQDLSIEEQRKTPRRVHFGGEIVKLRTPDSDDTILIMKETSKTRIPLPISPATRMPKSELRLRPSSQPNSPSHKRLQKPHRSHSSSPRREVYVHNANLSPKKGILTRTNSPIFFAEHLGDSTRGSGRKHSARKGRADSIEILANKQIERSLCENTQLNEGKAFHVCPETENNNEIQEENNIFEKPQEEKVTTPTSPIKDPVSSSETFSSDTATESAKIRPLRRKSVILLDNAEDDVLVSKSESVVSDKLESIESVDLDSQLSGSKNSSPGRGSPNRRRSSSFEVFPRQERNYILMELSSPVKHNNQKSESPQRVNSPFGSIVSQENYSESDFKEKSETDPDVQNEIVSDTVQENSVSTGEPKPAENNVAVETVSLDNIERNDSIVEGKEIASGAESVSSESKLQDVSSEKVALKVRDSKFGTKNDFRCKERNWEDLGLVDQEVLRDLHNKDDWRARVRALERIASVLRRSTALFAIEPRLGSLLHAVLGGERSCRVAAAGLDVARVVLTGVSEDALKRRLSLIAWGLARQGGPNAAQLARIAMLRLRPALFLEQLMQPQCIGARNAKTRENTLQLLIFSLVTFPSTEFNVKTLTNKVVNMVGDRRRRVRQAALDTLAVLAQIYETEDILQVGKEVIKDRHDRMAIIAAIRARLARKSLPMVSADGLVVYGLQISPTAQITTGADVDWIVAGSGSVSPGTGRTRGQIIATSKVENERIKRNEDAKNVENRWADAANIRAVSVVGKNDQLSVFKPKNDNRFPKRLRNKEESGFGEVVSNESVIEFDTDQRLEGKSRELCSAPGKINESLEEEFANTDKVDHFISFGSELKSKNYTPQIETGVEEKYRMSSAPPQEKKGESRIPILNSRGNEMKDSFNVQKRKNGTLVHNRELLSAMPGRNSKNYFENNPSRLIDENERKRSGNLYQKRKNLLASSAIPAQIQPLTSYTLNYSFDSNYNNYLLPSQVPTPESAFSNKSMNNDSRHKLLPEKSKATNIQANDYHTLTNSEKTIFKSQELLKYSKNDLKQVPFRQQIYDDTYSSIYQRQLRYMEENSVQKLQNRSGSFRQNYVESASKSNIFRNDKLLKQSTTEQQSYTSSSKKSTEQKARVIQSDNKSLGDDKSITSASVGSHSSIIYNPIYNSEKDVVDEERYNERNRRKLSIQSINYLEHNKEENTQNQVPSISRAASASSSVSHSSIDGNQKIKILNNLHDQNDATNTIHRNSQSPTLQYQSENKAFDIISENLNPSRKNSLESYIVANDKSPLSVKSDDVIIDKVLSSEEEDEKEDLSLKELENSIIKCSNENNIFNENENTSEEDNLTRNIIRTKSASSILSVESALNLRTSAMTRNALLSSQSLKELDNVHLSNALNKTATSKKSDPTFSKRPLSNNSFSKRNSASSLDLIRSPQKKWGQNVVDENDSYAYSLKHNSSDSLDFRNSLMENTHSNAILATSRSHTPENFNCDNTTRIVDSVSSSSSSENTQPVQKKSPQRFISDILPSKEDTFSSQSTGSEEPLESTASENNASGDLHFEVSPSSYQMDPLRRPTKLNMKPRGNATRGTRNADKEKAKINMQQCFNQLESKDWEVTMKALHTLSLIAKQSPEQLDSCSPGMIVRLLGKHVRNLRSQVSRAACIAAGDIFCLHLRGIDQDLDVLAGPLLNRTADTNKFLRADSNAALDRMVEHLPPHRTIGIIVKHGTTHQNAIVRAATARLLCATVDRIGPDYVMILPRDIRDKLFSTGAKLLIDGNLNARNHAKEIFRRLMHCEGFKKALSESVPESTLRHIEKTLKSL